MRRLRHSRTCCFCLICPPGRRLAAPESARRAVAFRKAGLSGESGADFRRHGFSVSHTNQGGSRSRKRCKRKYDAQYRNCCNVTRGPRADMVERVIGPTSHVFYSQRLKLHYVDWGNTDAPPLVLIHGGPGTTAVNWGLGSAGVCVSSTTLSRQTCAATGIRNGRAAGNTPSLTMCSTWRNCWSTCNCSPSP